MANVRTIQSIDFQSSISLKELTTIGIDPTLSNGAYTNSILGQLWKFDGTIGPLPTKAWHGQVALTAGAATLDLTALADAVLTTISMSGLKMFGIIAYPDAANTHTISVAVGGTNGYAGWGSIVDRGALGPLYYTSAVDGTHKTLDFVGTGTEKMNLVLLFGP